MSADVVVIGGGVAGLVAARELEAHHLDVVVLEESHRLGGRVCTLQIGDEHVELGGHELWGNGPAVQLAKELQLPLHSVGPFSSVIVDRDVLAVGRDQQYANAFTPDENASRHRFVHALRAARQATGANSERLASMSFEKWLAELRLEPRVAEWARAIIECEMASQASDFSALAGAHEASMFSGAAESTHRIAHGNQQLVDSLAKQIQSRIILGATAVAIDRRKPTRTRILYTCNGNLSSIEAWRVLVAVPFWRVLKIDYNPPLDSAMVSAIKSLHAGHYTVIHFLIEKVMDEPWGDRSVFPILSTGPLGVIYGPADGKATDSVTQVFTLLLYGERAKIAATSNVADLKTELLSNLEILWPGIAATVSSMLVFRYEPIAVAAWPTGVSQCGGALSALFEVDMGVYLAGDYLLGSHLDAAVESARRQSAKILADANQRVPRAF